MARKRPHRVHSSQLGVIVYPPQGGTEKSNLLLKVLTCRKELQLSGLGRQALKNAGRLFLSVFRRFGSTRQIFKFAFPKKFSFYEKIVIRASCKTSKIGTLSFRPKGEILINTLRYKIPHYVRNDTERYFARGSFQKKLLFFS